MIGRAFLSDTLPGSPPAAHRSRSPRRRDPRIFADSSRAGRSGSGHARRERAAPGHRGDARPAGSGSTVVRAVRRVSERTRHRQSWIVVADESAGDCGHRGASPATFELAFAAVLVATAIAIPLGILAAVRAGTHVDYAATTLALVGISIPDFWLGPLLAIVFSIMLGWLPVSGRGTAAHLVLPAIHARCAAVGRARPHDARAYSRSCGSRMCWRRGRAASHALARSSVTLSGTA
ncbi:MAG: hypothetical protein DMF95_10925 [Acidobacteria bacterium]|nr:MAG: hypothetical protein DMF95_10925 [Acidobacteriota bacterium]